MHRRCSKDSTWDAHIDFSECHTVEYLTLIEQANEAFTVLTTKATDTVVRFNLTEIDTIAEDLSHLTNSSELILPNDIDTVIDIIDMVFNILG